MKKVSAVEWLAQQLDLGLSENGLKSVINQAKEMEKQQIIEAYDKISMNTAEQYYNEQYKNK